MRTQKVSQDVFKGLCDSRLCQSMFSDWRCWANLNVGVYFDSPLS